MKCKECNSTEVIKINKPEHVRFQCKQGHTWVEEYVDKGGSHRRPKSYKIKVEDILFPSEKILYEKVLSEIAKNQNFFISSNPEKVINYLTEKCKFNQEEIYRLFKKITKFNNKVEK
ncbi:hypothetical protein [Clostridium formicaceticum]|uniref:Uncharacterized protein n=1 Tax=Clostridium formicaceticum TaxID=1497 RepID=A0AAC9RLR8_9CLOT|nr:hypothetical protein [Clostridium formicaceticum]AOY77457.1 hypothetical protein BJL90_17310 [Clostridium formicaceticum]ARE88014.1 hypothetical protein CLFO_24150 [Clostridium formicaceticum]